MNTILIIAALIQLIVIIVVVYAILDIKNKVNKMSDTQSSSYKLRKVAYQIHIPEHTHPLIPVELSLQEQQ